MLRLFEDCTPNYLHHVIADYAVRERCWIITTNFDDCIERASNGTIPVHHLSRKSGKLEVMNGAADCSWGLVKIHGTIEDGVEELGATIRDLAPGLHSEYRKILDRVFDSAELTIVAGYSGSDHFDVNQYLRERSNERHKPDLLWIFHSEGTAVNERQCEYEWHCDRLHPLHAWESAFARRKFMAGVTQDILAQVLNGVIPIRFQGINLVRESRRGN